MEPREIEITSRRSKKLALLCLVINGLESLVGGYGCTDIRASIEGSKIHICYRDCQEEIDNGYELDEAVDYGLISSYSINKCGEGLKLQTLYNRALDQLVRFTTSYLSTYALRTMVEGVEYMVLVLRNGRALLLRGTKNRVIIPGVKALVSAHTHPQGCIPSPHDIRSFINMLLEGGFGSGIISNECKLFIVRSGPFLEEDYVALSKFRGILSSRDISKIRNIISRGIIGKNLKIFLIT